MLKSQLVIFIFISIINIFTISEVSSYSDVRSMIENSAAIYEMQYENSIIKKASNLDVIVLDEIKKTGDIETLISFGLTHKLKSKKVTVTAYNNLASQCDSTPNICAWGDRIKPGVIAVSRNLLGEGMGRNTKVYIPGYGSFVVLDKMNKRYRDRIDIFVGSNISKAMEFGKKELKIYWRR